MLRFGLIGTGFWAATVHAPGIAAHPGTELVGVWGRDPAKRATLAAQYAAQPFSDVDALIGAVDAVAFAVAPDIQSALAVHAARAGRALLLEKPLALMGEAADRLVEAVRAPTVVFFTARFDPAVSAWFESELQGSEWEGGSAVFLSSIFVPGNPLGESQWRRDQGARPVGRRPACFGVATPDPRPRRASCSRARTWRRGAPCAAARDGRGQQRDA